MASHWVPTNFKFFDENSIDVKQHNKQEFIKLISKFAKDKEYKKDIIPVVDIYKFDDIEKSVKDIAKTPIFCATSRLVEQKGYDIAAKAIKNVIENHTYKEYPIFALGGAGDVEYSKFSVYLKDAVDKISLLVV